jgi:tetratricopeptide (TPR) repeat protein
MAAQASEALQQAEAIARARGDLAGAEEAQLALAQSLIFQARYEEVIELAQSLLEGESTASRAAHVAGSAEAVWGTALSLEGADLAGAANHLQKAAAQLRAESGPPDLVRLAQVRFELGSVTAQQGDLPQAITLYREALALAESSESPLALPFQILAHNNIAYHLHLLDDPAAIDYARASLRLAQEKGAPGLHPFLLSTLGEIALAAGEAEAAEKYFADGLALAERLSIPERIAGLTANLGRVAARRGETALAIHRLSTALARADSLGTRHLAAQIRLWLAPLLPPSEARAALAEARAIADSGGRKRLLEEVERLESLTSESGAGS